ncbi:cytochrome c [Cytophagaceae bacterium YF14B1]|uniref:Cytochrome c n=1 Tax=Xanthocytophaga flava TaxID=3048013 RepID=A0AAE3U766_9BACT|nr:cytochrome c [Xanthocytophaga flavus]MDJ1479823.1 cytochrome c [Xanthocytophaga flavus]
MEETIKKLQIALGVLLIALLVVFITGAALIISYKPEPVVITPKPGDPTQPPKPAAPAALDPVAQKGESLFKNNCAACHSAGDDVVVGPGLKGISKRAPSKDWLYKWIHNSSAVVASGDAYGNQIFNKFNKIPMQSFPDLANEDIDAILKYLDAQGG